jgi:hypothetical protein
VLPGIERQPRKKLDPSPERLLAVLHRWRDEAVRAGKEVTRITLAFEAGRDDFGGRQISTVNAHDRSVYLYRGAAVANAR